MKKILTLALALMLVLSLAACGNSGSSNTPSDNSTDPGTSQQQPSNTPDNSKPSGSSYAIKDINADNWAEVMKENFGIEMALPDGWTVKEVSSLNGVSNVKMFFVPGGTDTYDTFGETLFAACKAASTQGDMDKATFTESAMVQGVCTWSYCPALTDDEGQAISSVVVNYYDNGSDIEMTFQR